MDKIIMLEEFNKKLVLPLTEDIRRTLEVTCHQSGKNNHGSNFIGNIVVLMGIETISQFTNPISEKDDEQFKEAAKLEFKGLGEKVNREYLCPKNSKIDGSKLAKKFMNKYFGSWFSEKRIFEVPLSELIWAFRNSHAHSFYPYYQKTFNKKQICGAVDWLYKEKNEKIGIKISEIESNFEDYREKLYSIDGCCFRICPQILFVFFKRAIMEYVNSIHRCKEIENQYAENYKKLSNSYGFVLE